MTSVDPWSAFDTRVVLPLASFPAIFFVLEADAVRLELGNVNFFCFMEAAPPKFAGGDVELDEDMAEVLAV